MDKRNRKLGKFIFEWKIPSGEAEASIEIGILCLAWAPVGYWISPAMALMIAGLPAFLGLMLLVGGIAASKRAKRVIFIHDHGIRLAESLGQKEWLFAELRSVRSMSVKRRLFFLIPIQNYVALRIELSSGEIIQLIHAGAPGALPECMSTLHHILLRATQAGVPMIKRSPLALTA